MTDAWHFSKVRLSESQGVRAIVSLLQPHDDDERAVAAHRLLWTLFAQNPEDDRDFLWREIAGPGAFRTYYVLSPRPPVDAHSLFEIQSKPYALSPSVGTKLAFELRVNATVTRKDGDKSKRHDIVMDGLRAFPKGNARAAERERIAQQAGVDWLSRKGEAVGFRLEENALVETYQTWRLPRAPRQPPLSLGVLDMKGIIEVTDPTSFVAGVLNGFGRAKAFGLGMMLLKRI